MCPMCYESFESPESLQEHFELNHNQNNISSSPSTTSIASNSNLNATSVNTGIENPIVK